MSLPKIAVLGLSHGLKFVKCLKENKIAELVAVADLDPQNAIQSYNINNVSVSDCIGKGVEVYSDYKELIKSTKGRLDGVVAALPNHLHVEVTKEAAKAGLALMLEKPIACNIDEAKKIIEITENSGMKFLVAHHRRFSKKVLKVKEVIEAGRLGNIIGAEMIWAAKKHDEYYEQEWRIAKDIGGPLLINTIHDVDNLRFLIGEIDSVQAFIANKSRGNLVEDSGVIIFSFKNGAVASIFLTDNSPSLWYYEACTQEYEFFYPSYFNCYKFFGDKASLTFPNLELFYYEQGKQAGWQRPIKQEKLVVERFDVLAEELKHFCDVIKGEAESKINARDATLSLIVVEAIKKSSETGKAVKISDL